MSKKVKNKLKDRPDCWHLYDFHMLEVFYFFLCFFFFFLRGGGGGGGGSGLSL